MTLSFKLSKYYTSISQSQNHSQVKIKIKIKLKLQILIFKNKIFFKSQHTKPTISSAPRKLDIEFSIILIWNNQLVILSRKLIAIMEMPRPITLRFVVLELSLIVCSVWISPSSRQKLVFKPLSDILHSSSVEDIGSLSMLFAVDPIS